MTSKVTKSIVAHGSPAPEFETDHERSYFLIRLPVHEKAANWAGLLPETVVDPGASMVAEDTPLYGMKEAERISKLLAPTQEVYGEIERELKLVGLWESIPARNKLGADLQKAISQPEFSQMPGLVKARFSFPFPAAPLIERPGGHPILR